MVTRAKHPSEYSMTITNIFKVKEPKYHIATQPFQIYEICKDMADLGQEVFCVLTLNTVNQVIDRHMITAGILDASLVHPREVFRPAITDGAAAIVLCHNHPSGKANPSSDDLRVTKQMIEAGKVIDIRVLDHVVIGNPDYISMRESGIVTF